MAGDLTQNDIDVILERRLGWEKAEPRMLASIFGVSVQRINAICRAPRPQLRQRQASSLEHRHSINLRGE